MRHDPQDYIRRVREEVAGRLDLTRNVSDDEIREVIFQIVQNESAGQRMTLSEKKLAIDFLLCITT